MSNLGINQTKFIFQNIENIPWLFILTVITATLLSVHYIKRYIPMMAEKMPPRFRFYLLPMVPILRLFLMIGAISIIVPCIIQPSLQNFFAIFGAVGLALGFAFKDFASSLIAGIIALYEQPYRPGDRVRIDNVYGEVQSLNLRSLRIITPDDTVVTVPHSKIWDNCIHNSNDGSREQLCVAEFYLHPEHDASLVRQTLKDVALASPFIQLMKPVNVILREYPWGTEYRVKAYPIDARDEFNFVSDLTVRGKSAIMSLNIKFANAPISASFKTTNV